MSDNSKLVNENTSHICGIFNVVVEDQEVFESLDFEFFTDDPNEPYVVLPDGWTSEFDEGGFMITLYDTYNNERGGIEYGNHPIQEGRMWLYDGE